MNHPGGSPGPANAAADRFVSLFAAAPIGIALTDSAGGIVEANHALGTLLGMDHESLRGTAFGDLVSGEGDAALVRALMADPGSAPAGGKRLGVVLEHAEDGPVRVEITIATLPGDDPGQRYPVIMVEDVNDLHLLQERLHHQNVHDALTGLPNAASFHGKLETAMVDRAYPQVALVVFDIDGFRVINDGFGADVGDQLLRHMSAKLRAAFPPDAVIARLTGDGFGVLLRGTFAGQTLTRQVEQALHDLAEPVYFEGSGVGLSASVGIVVRDVGHGTASDLERAAEITVHRAKTAGRAQWMLFDGELDRHDRRQARRGAMIGGALETGQFELTFHPTVRPDGSDRIVVMQTEMRWNNPEHGPLSPREYLPLADVTGMTLHIGRWMLAEAMATIAKWRAELGPTVPDLSVRLPTRLAIDQDLVGLVRTELEQHELPPHVLCVCTKAAAVRDPRGEVVESLGLLGELGVQVDLLATNPGDFEAFTHDLNVCHVVLADALVDTVATGFPVDPRAAMRGLQDLIAPPMARGIRVAAQGVRTREQAQRLADLGVIAVRGPFLHGALTAAAMHVLLSAQVAAE
ncbi:MAG: diguanylate cyclase domain-containing protein [Thermocrispum sp.]